MRVWDVIEMGIRVSYPDSGGTNGRVGVGSGACSGGLALEDRDQAGKGWTDGLPQGSGTPVKRDWAHGEYVDNTADPYIRKDRIIGWWGVGRGRPQGTIALGLADGPWQRREGWGRGTTQGTTQGTRGTAQGTRGTTQGTREHDGQTKGCRTDGIPMCTMYP